VVWLLLEALSRFLERKHQTNALNLLRRRSSALVEGQEFWACWWFLSHFSDSLWQAGRKTYTMVSSRSPAHSLASELVESSDGHEEVIKVSFVHLSPPSPLLFIAGTGEGLWFDWKELDLGC
jgi:hypothetical protein